jgi:putative drug exporter of the RND superfamily
MALVPAVMQLLGSRNWWIPNWLERTLPRLDVERVAPAAAEGRP